MPLEIERPRTSDGSLLPSVAIHTLYGEGDKQLEVIFSFEQQSIITCVTNQEGLPKEPGATSRIHQRGMNLMQEVANMTGLDLKYTFSSDNPNMKCWAFNAGGKIFRWDSIEKNASGAVYACRTFHPQEGKGNF
jgi:hypothetical protein